LHGSGVARELLQVSTKRADLEFSLDGYVSNANYRYVVQVLVVVVFVEGRRATPSLSNSLSTDT
jgi:hypothetical protein